MNTFLLTLISEHIESDPARRGGELVLRTTRYPLAQLLTEIVDKSNLESICQDLELDPVTAKLAIRDLIQSLADYRDVVNVASAGLSNFIVTDNVPVTVESIRQSIYKLRRTFPAPRKMVCLALKSQEDAIRLRFQMSPALGDPASRPQSTIYGVDLVFCNSASHRINEAMNYRILGYDVLILET